MSEQHLSAHCDLEFQITQALDLQTAERLQALATVAIAAHDASHSDAMDAKRKMHSGIHYAVICGKALSAARDSCEHGQWNQWLTLNCPHICRMTASRYIRLANDANVTHVLQTGQLISVRKGYLLADVINEPKQKITKHAERPTIPDFPSEDPMDAKHIDFEYEEVSFEPEIQVALEDAKHGEHTAAEALAIVLRWIIRGEITTIGQRAAALGWVLNIVDTSKFNTVPSLAEMAQKYHVNDTSLSRYSAEAFAKFNVRNRAQAHGDGVRA